MKRKRDEEKGGQRRGGEGRIEKESCSHTSPLRGSVLAASSPPLSAPWGWGQWLDTHCHRVLLESITGYVNDKT